MVGRSNVGKSSLINALVRQTLARTSAAPGKTRLANFYRVQAGGSPPFFLVDLPGYGYARGGDAARATFDQLAGGRTSRPAAAPRCCWWTAGIRAWTRDCRAWTWLVDHGVTATSSPRRWTS